MTSNVSTSSVSFAIPPENASYGVPGNGNPTTGIGGANTPFFQQELDLLPGMSYDDPSADNGANPGTGMQPTIRKAINSNMANDNIDQKFVMLIRDTPLGRMARSLRPGQVVFCESGPGAIDSQLPRAVFMINLQTLNWELANNPGAYPDLASIFARWNLLGVLKIDNVSEGKRDAIFNPGRLMGVTMWGETHVLENIFGNDVHQGSGLYFIFKKQRVKDTTVDQLNPLGQYAKKPRTENALVWQAVPWSSSEYHYPRLCDREYEENGVRKFGKPVNFGTAVTEETMSTTADLQRSQRDGMLGMPRITAILRKRVF